MGTAEAASGKISLSERQSGKLSLQEFYESGWWTPTKFICFVFVFSFSLQL